MAPVPATPAAIVASATLKDAQAWDVTSPLPLAPSGRGHKFVSAHLTPAARRRRIQVEVHRAKSVFESAVTADADPMRDTEVCYVRILERSGKRHDLEPLAHKIKGDAKKAKEGTVNFFTGSHRWGGGDDDGSDGGSLMEAFREAQAIGGGAGLDSGGWQPKYKIPLRMFRIVERKKRSIVTSIEEKDRSICREFVFQNEPAMRDFCAVIEMNEKLSKSRLQTQREVMLGTIELKTDEQLTLLFDICSGANLPRSDIAKDSDPYITVRFNGRRVHKTDFISTNANPIWTLQKGALFIWKVAALQLFESEEGLVFEVKDHDAVGSNDSLGAFNINARTLYKWNGERRSFALKPLLGEKNYKKGRISLRVRRATTHDIEFMDKFHEKSKGNLINFPNVISGAAIKSIMTIHSKKEKEGPDKGKTKYLVRPGPDPKRNEETSWLTKERIEEESMAQSYSWTDIGTGSLGKIFVEIIACDQLPNMDTSSTLGDKTDSFVSLVYEDCFAKTDVIADCLSPRWMPWTQRAFIFNMTHTSSQLFLGVFDNDDVSSHDLIGRVSIDISNFRPNSLHLLQYNLYRSAKCGPREPKGSIKIRLRLDLENERTLLLSNFQLPLSVNVNVDKKRDYGVIKQTVEGAVDMDRYNPLSVYKFYDELWTYLFVYYALEDSFLSLLFWRGSSIISLPVPSYSSRSIIWIDVRFPLHSLVAFISTVILAENPNLLPTFFFGCIGWLLLAMQERRTNNPSLWIQCKSFSHFLSALILGDSVIMGPNEKNAERHSKDISWDNRMKEANMKATKKAEEYAAKQEQYFNSLEDNYMNEDKDTLNIGNFQGFMITASLKIVFGSLQQWLSFACTWLRVLTNILCWEECYISFWITIISFLFSLVAIFVPWGFVIQWTMRIVAWVVFGPWMKLVDTFYFIEETDEQKRVREKRLEGQSLDTQIAKEKAAKLEDFKKWMFGEHACRVNVLKKDRYYDLPLPASTVTSYIPKSKSLAELAMQEAGYHCNHIEGQRLVGEMIPQIYKSPTTEVPTGRPTRRTDLLEKGSPAASYDGNDSFTTAAIKVGSILVSAGAITWVVVPLFVHLVRLVLPE